MNQLVKRQKQIHDFTNSAEYQNLRAFYSRPSILSAFGVSRQETTHTNFLAWLLNPASQKNDHGLGDLPLRKLLETLALVCNSLPHAKGKLAQDIVMSLSAGNYALSEVVAEKEKNLAEGRLDIYITGVIALSSLKRPFTIAIENKIKASEHDNQTCRYRDDLARIAAPQELQLFVYLTPCSNQKYENLTAPECEAKEFIQLNYQYLADYVIAPCCDQTPAGPIKQYLAEYLFALGRPELHQDRGDIVMATTKEERDLLSQFWDTHKDLLTAAILSMLEGDIFDETEQENAEGFIQAFTKAASERDLTKYSWAFEDAGNTNLSKSRLVLEIVTHYAQTNADMTLKRLKTIFPDEIQGGTLGVIVDLDTANPDKFKGHKRYKISPSEVLLLKDGPAVVCNQWGRGNIDNFITCARELGYSIDSIK